MEKATVRIRPLRLAFAVNPKNGAALMRVFEANSIFWGGLYNFILPLFKRVPDRYNEPYRKKIKAAALVRGLVDAFQPDIIVEVEPGSATFLNFPKSRTITLDQFLGRDDRGGCNYGVDIRTIIADLYERTFRFVQRHPPQVVIPASSNCRYALVYAALFGSLPEEGPVADCSVHFLEALDGKREFFAPADYPKLLDHNYIYPLTVAAHGLETKRNSWSIDSKLYYMDERSPLDLIDFWNLRALGWDITPLPASLAPSLTGFCEEFIEKSYRPYPPPSNAYHHASFLCSPSNAEADMKAFVATLKRPQQKEPHIAMSFDMRVPRIWEEWGRSADHAEPQTVTESTASVDSYLIGSGLHVSTAVPKFLEDDVYASSQHACGNVLEFVPGGAPVIPWASGELTGLVHDVADKSVWISKEGIVTTAARFSSSRFLRAPSPINVFTAFAKSKGLSLAMSPAGDTCEQIIKALGGLRSINVVARSPELLRFLDRLAHENFEIETDATPARKVRKAYASYSSTLEVVKRTTPGSEIVVTNFFNALINTGVLTVGLTLRCKECNHSSWHTLDSLAPAVTCPRCLGSVAFPSALPPRREHWAYKVSGPFAAEHFAHGAYCVASTLHFLTDRVVSDSTWLPSFRLTNADGKEIEADFAMFGRPNRFSHATSPFLVLGECKSFNVFETEDFAKARYLASLFPGAVLCFATLRETLNPDEIKTLTRLVLRGRKFLRTGKLLNPVLILTGKELFSQFYWNRQLGETYGARAKHAEIVYTRRDIEELCSFSQQVHLGMSSYHEWLDEKRRRRMASIKRSKATPRVTSST
jgi:hypothetical protein